MDLETILLAGEKHFFAKEYSDVKLDNIANELGIKKPSLYYYFANKRDFYLKTLKYSMKKYVQELRIIVEKSDLGEFIARYLDYPSRKQNLFAIAAQKGYGDDKEINTLVEMGKNIINTDMGDFLSKYKIRPITTFLVCELLDKLAMDNCIDGYCLEYSIEELTQELQRIIESQQ